MGQRFFLKIIFFPPTFRPIFLGVMLPETNILFILALSIIVFIFEDRMEAVKDDEIAETMSEADSVDSTSTSPPKKEKVLTGRGVTLSMLMADGVVQHGKECLSIEYLVRIHCWAGIQLMT